MMNIRKVVGSLPLLEVIASVEIATAMIGTTNLTTKEEGSSKEVAIWEEAASEGAKTMAFMGAMIEEDSSRMEQTDSSEEE
jgi:hypothetical protein